MCDPLKETGEETGVCLSASIVEIFIASVVPREDIDDLGMS